MEWKPIKSAPKVMRQHILLGSYDDKAKWECDVGYWGVEDTARDNPEWFHCLDNTPTHWHPLPLPPKK